MRLLVTGSLSRRPPCFGLAVLDTEDVSRAASASAFYAPSRARLHVSLAVGGLDLYRSFRVPFLRPRARAGVSSRV